MLEMQRCRIMQLQFVKDDVEVRIGGNITEERDFFCRAYFEIVRISRIYVSLLVSGLVEELFSLLVADFPYILTCNMLLILLSLLRGLSAPCFRDLSFRSLSLSFLFSFSKCLFDMRNLNSLSISHYKQSGY
jgi:hypothetical protein